MTLTETKEEKKVQKFLALESWAHRAYGLVKLGVNGEKLDEALKKTQDCIHECRRAVNG